MREQLLQKIVGAESELNLEKQRSKKRKNIIEWYSGYIKGLKLALHIIDHSTEEEHE